MFIREILLKETASAGATSAGAISTVVNPDVAIGNSVARKAYGKKGANPKPPKALQRKNSNGTAKNALDLQDNLFGGEIIKR